MDVPTLASCLSYSPLLLQLHVGADLVLFVSFCAVAVAVILYLHRKQPEFHNFGYVAAGVCVWFGLLFLGDAISYWVPIHLLVGGMKAITALGLLVFAVAMFPLMPRLVEKLTPNEYEGVLRQVWSTNEQLRRQIKEQSAISDNLTGELTSRVRNILATVHGIAKETAAGTADTKTFLEAFNARLSGLTHFYDVLLANHWKGAPLSEVVNSQLEQYFGLEIKVEGPEVFLQPRAAQQISMAIHELAANTAEHSNGSTPECHVSWASRQDGNDSNRTLMLNWKETREEAVEEIKGFGQVVLNYITPTLLDGLSELRANDKTLEWMLVAPMTSLCVDANMRGVV